MHDLDFLNLLAASYPTAGSAAAEIINLEAICDLPKGTEYFFSDLHGEYESFIHLMRSASGMVRSKIRDAFGTILTEKEQLDLADLITYPERVLAARRAQGTLDADFLRVSAVRLIRICRVVSHKYTRSKIRKNIPPRYAYALDELLNEREDETSRRNYYRRLLDTAIAIGSGEEFILDLCTLIRRLTIDSLHIIGDIFDRGPRPDIILNELIQFHDVDIQWGNHDVSWIGAASGNAACICNVLRIAVSYNSFDVLEDGYGINLRPLSMFAASVYGDDPCSGFRPHLLDENLYDRVDPVLAARMCKAIAVMQFKAEGQLIKRRPEFDLNDRLLLHRMNLEKGTIVIDGREYRLNDTHFPTIDPADPYRFSPEEQELMNTLQTSFAHSASLAAHIRFIYSHGSMYKVCNNNLLFHGCIPMDENGNFASLTTRDGSFSGRELLDYLNEKIIRAYFMDAREDPQEKQFCVDLLWYLWCGPKSPLFGKDKLTAFEHCFIDDPISHVERYNIYYHFSREEEYVDRILREFGLDPACSRLINGHVPVRTNRGERPVKSNGKLYIIDGGMSKAYQPQTGIAGYTLLYSSEYIALAEHKPYRRGSNDVPNIQITERFAERIRVRDTDTGRILKKKIDDLTELLEAYRSGRVK